jgi:hypothetical protein
MAVGEISYIKVSSFICSVAYSLSKMIFASL